MIEGPRATLSASPLPFPLVIDPSPPLGDAGEVAGRDEQLPSLLSSFVNLLPVEDVAASALGSPFDVETLAASSDRAAGLDEAQIDLGEGPAWDAYRSLRPVAMHLDEHRGSWPFFASSLSDAGACSVLAVPLLVGTLSIGAVSLYSSEPLVLGAKELRLAKSLSTLFARAVVSRALTEADGGDYVRDPALSRREVHQATGMVLSQTRSTPAEALLTIRGYAFAAGMSVRDVAAEIVGRRLDFSPDSADQDLADQDPDDQDPDARAPESEDPRK